MRKIFLVLLCIPSLTFATIGDEINAVLRSFFGGEELIESNEQRIENNDPRSTIYDPSSDTKDIISQVPALEIPDSPSQDDLDKLKKQVFLEEDDLAFTELEIDVTLAETNKMLDQKQQLQGEVSQLDIQLGKVSQRLEELRVQAKKRKEELISLTQQRTDLRALLRVREREYKAFLQQNYLEQEAFGKGEAISMLRWLFADATVSQILEERSQQKQFEVEKKARLQALQALEQELKTNEAYMAVLYGQMARLRDQVAAEKKLVSDQVYTKASRMTELSKQEDIKKQELRNLRIRQAQSTQLLQNLRQAVSETIDHLETQENPMMESFFGAPLNLELLKVTASFHDEVYKQEIGQEHNGVDFYAPFGTPVYAVAGGKVQKVGNNGYGYSYVVIEHADDFLTLYGHLSDIYINEGMMIDRGDLVAKTGGEGGGHGTGVFSTGKHLHFEMMREGRYVDPMRFLKIE